MAQIKGTNVASPVVPFDTADANPSHEAKYGKGGYRTAATTAERDAIPAARREAGMLVFVAEDETIYQLGADLTTWDQLAVGGSVTASAPITYDPETNAVGWGAFSNGTSLAVGTFDIGLGGYSGISLNCAIGYELNWQAGHLQSTADGGVTAATIWCDSPITWNGATGSVTINSAGLTLAGGSPGTGVTQSQMSLEYQSGGGYRNWIATTHNVIPAGNAILFFTSDGSQYGSFPDNGILGLTIENGQVIIGANGIKFSDDTTQNTAAESYSLPTATDTVLGGVKIGSGVTITDGVISVATNYAAATHSHAIGDVTNLQTTLDGKASTTHSHSISDVTGLQTALDGKQASGSYSASTHAHGNITNAGAIGTTSGQVVVTTTAGVLTTAATISAGAVSGLATSATTDATNAANISAGTLPEGRLPNSVILHPFLLAGM